uniref:Uncharacterized protein n=1 Tax=Rhizophora mucronata TaxID=61149 RepID=A0A2P2PYL2_RHIMU
MISLIVFSSQCCVFCMSFLWHCFQEDFFHSKLHCKPLTA